MPHEIRTLLEARRFRVVEELVPRPIGDTARCVYVQHPGSVAILPFIDDQRVCLIRNRRLTVDKTLVEVPAGTRELDEPPLVTARRELAEETGYQAAHFHELTKYYPSPGVLSEQLTIFVARDLTPGPPAREANEQIDNLLVTWDDALAMLDRGEIEDGKTIVALLMYERHRQNRAAGEKT